MSDIEQIWFALISLVRFCNTNSQNRIYFVIFAIHVPQSGYHSLHRLYESTHHGIGAGVSVGIGQLFVLIKVSKSMYLLNLGIFDTTMIDAVLKIYAIPSRPPQSVNNNNNNSDIFIFRG